MHIKITMLAIMFCLSLNAKFQVLTLSPNNKTVVLVRCNTETGEGFYRIGNKWHKGVEENPVGKSSYHCQAQTFGSHGWILVRLDQNSGRMWTLQNEVWRVVLQ